MKNPKLSNRYAKALFDFAQEKGQIEEVYQDLALIKATLKGNSEMQAVLNSPVIPPAKKHTVFANVFQPLVSETTFLFLDVIIRKKREPALMTICDEFVKYYNDFHHIKTVKLTSAQPLSAELVENIRSLLAEKTQQTIQIEQVVQPDIIGGFRLKMDDYYLDASIIAKLNRLRNEFAHNVYQVNF